MLILKIFRLISLLYFISLLLLGIAFFYFFFIYPPMISSTLVKYLLIALLIFSIFMLGTLIPGFVIEKRYKLILNIIVVLVLVVGIFPHSSTNAFPFYSYLRYYITFYLIYLLYLIYGKHYLLNKYYPSFNIVSSSERHLILFLFVIFISLYNPFVIVSVSVIAWRLIDICLLIFLLYLVWNHKTILRNLMHYKLIIGRKSFNIHYDSFFINQLYLQKIYPRIDRLEFRVINSFDGSFTTYLDKIENQISNPEVRLSFMDRFFLNFNYRRIFIKNGDFVFG